MVQERAFFNGVPRLFYRKKRKNNAPAFTLLRTGTAQKRKKFRKSLADHCVVASLPACRHRQAVKSSDPMKSDL